MDDIDIWQTANFLFKEHGKNAMLIAARRADALLANGYREGYATWVKIFHALDELEDQMRVRAGELALTKGPF